LLDIPAAALEIEQRMVGRLVDEIHAGRRVMTGYIGEDLRRGVIPSELVTAERLLPLLANELMLGNARYIGIRIQTSEPIPAVRPPKVERVPPPELATLTDPDEPAVAKPPAKSTRSKPKTARPALPRGPREAWDWSELAELLEAEKPEFKDWAAFVRYCQTHVQRPDKRPRGEDPETKTVIEAIERHSLQNHVKIRGANDNEAESS
jgi:hypothetical protein